MGTFQLTHFALQVLFLERKADKMPRIDTDVKLDFKDVLLRPKRSTLKSRADVDLYREIRFRNSKQTFRGIPIIASNMDTVGTFEMATSLAKHGMFTTIHKHYKVEDWVNFSKKNKDALGFVAVSSGSGKADFEKLKKIIEAVPDIRFICLDVANGYSEQFVEYVRSVREAFPQHVIMAGNVVTGEMVEELILSGADIIKVGSDQDQCAPLARRPAWATRRSAPFSNVPTPLTDSEDTSFRTEAARAPEMWPKLSELEPIS